jgi:hypothetical protein
VTGGSIIGSSSNHDVSIEWTSTGTGTLTVTENDGTCSSASEVYEVEVHNCTSVSEGEKELIKIYPNPADDMIFIKTTEIIDPGTSEWRIMNAVGNLVEWGSFKSGNEIITVNSSNYPAGIYLVQLITGSSSLTKRVVVR